MVFSSLPFICFFLPLVLLLHTLIRNGRVRNLLLMLASLLFYSYGEPIYILLLIGSVTVNYFLGLALKGREHVNKKSRARSHGRTIIVLGVIFNIGLLAVFKYTGFIVGELSRLLPASMQLTVPRITLPIGISFYTFQVLSYLIDVYRGETPVQKNYISLMLYVSFFPQLIAGPIVKYHDVAEQIDHRILTAEGMSRGMLRFIAGLGKKVLIANGMALIADRIFAAESAGLGAAAAWLGALAYLFQIYFDFSGYSDMAIGLGYLFGFRFKENFLYPYLSSSISEFWRRWHVSLGSWFREYLYIPMGGSRGSLFATCRNLFIVFFCTGLWHGAAWTFVAWGLIHGILVILERLGCVPLVKNKITGTIYTMFFVTMAFVVFRAESLAQAWRMVKACFTFKASSGAAYASLAGLLGPYTVFLFAAAIFLATPYLKKGWRRLYDGRGEKGKLIQMGITMLGALLVLLLCLMQLATDSYNPFIYFRF